MRYIVAIDRTGIHTMPVTESSSPYLHPEFIAERCIYTYGIEYVAATWADDPGTAREAGLEILAEHFPESLRANS